MIPLPMLWQSTLKTFKKVLSSLVLCAGVFVVVCAILKTIFVLVVSCTGFYCYNRAKRLTLDF